MFSVLPPIVKNLSEMYLHNLYTEYSKIVAIRTKALCLKN